ncbi:STELLO glycosyltransferase family protein [Tunicatimonas pelagia]|uniref:STELLO glycosyltransferase family protein n=1 Tax=Tunicatimonas pelagia TaxID=931531 RepID=UPI0026651B6D|nr:STELLO glycosyltransferase family protein [Tunicatimonas pelagia]WKN44452.1 STELLO glycosyltransferase family protein [Tunicatimonas pelagia]
MVKYIVITTINPKTPAVESFERKEGWSVLLIGDTKSQEIENSNNLTFLNVETQKSLPYTLIRKCPHNHYTRKNIGYLYALQKGAELIYDTDDDNLPYEDWGFPNFNVEISTLSGSKFCNIYSYYTDEKVWPRGFPLELINSAVNFTETKEQQAVGVWQGLADLDPDVDAIHRLIFGKTIRFEANEPIVLDKGVYCPFNSQNTLWQREMVPYAYLPATVTFRFTDILRGYIAQRCLWEHGKKLGFTKATVYQERNEHDLLKDFESEIPCYLEIGKLVQILDGLVLSNDFDNNLMIIYQALIKEGIVPEAELPILKAWINDIGKIIT